MALGKYIIPKKVSLAGSDEDLCKGSGTNGLDEDFESAVNEFLDSDDFNATGYHVELGYSGYVSKESAESWTKSGNPYFSEDAIRRRFGWGLGWEIDRITKNGTRGAITGIALSEFVNAVQSIANDYGIKVVRFFSNSGWSDSDKLFFTPEHIDVDEDAEEMSYVGTEVSSASRMSSTTTASGSGASLAAASYFFANQFGGAQDATMSNMLQGERALANDVDLWSYVKKAVNASLRVCASDPDGNFIAWYPDYWGKAGTTPQVIIEDVELLDLTITQSDEEFYSHVFCPGVDISGSQMDMLWTQGVVSIESDTAAKASSAAANASAGSSDSSESLDDTIDTVVSDQISPILSQLIYVPEGEQWKYSPKELYRRYGARPAKTRSLPFSTGGQMIESVQENVEAEDSGSSPEHILPYLYALYEFMYHWAQQHKADIKITFMPELFPGMRIKVKSLDIEFYVQSVTHNMNYSSGFTTTVGAICPVGSLVSGMVKSSEAQSAGSGVSAGVLAGLG